MNEDLTKIRTFATYYYGIGYMIHIYKWNDKKMSIKSIQDYFSGKDS